MAEHRTGGDEAEEADYGRHAEHDQHSEEGSSSKGYADAEKDVHDANSMPFVAGWNLSVESLKTWYYFPRVH